MNRIEITKCREIIEACYVVAEKYPETAEEYNIKFFVDSSTEYWSDFCFCEKMRP